MKLSTIIIFLSGFSSAKFQWKKQYSKGQAAKSECRVNIVVIILSRNRSFMAVFEFNERIS